MRVQRWARVEEFKPSSVQVLNYLRHQGYAIPKHKKTKRDTTDEDSLEFLSAKHPEDPVLDLVLETRRYKKALEYLADTHVWKDNRFHPIYTFHPDTGRLSSRRPNLMNVPRGRKSAEEEAAEAIRGTIVAPEGYLLIEADWRAIEALLVGWFAGDSDYMRLARLGVHANLASHYLGTPADLSLSDAELKLLFGRIKKSNSFVYDQSKQIVHATAYGETLFAISKTLEKMRMDEAKRRGEFLGKTPAEIERRLKEIRQAARREAARFVSLYETMAPKVRTWQASTKMRAQKEGFLRNPFDYVRRYFDVYQPKYDKTGEPVFDENMVRVYVDGDQANAALSFLPQSTAAGMLRETLLEFDRILGDSLWLLPLVPIHDSILFAVEEAQVERAQKFIPEIMQRPFPQLNGLWCEVELKTPARYWADMES